MGNRESEHGHGGRRGIALRLQSKEEAPEEERKAKEKESEDEPNRSSFVLFCWHGMPLPLPLGRSTVVGTATASHARLHWAGPGLSQLAADTYTSGLQYSVEQEHTQPGRFVNISTNACM
jgi:hypothetical protein